MSDESAKLVAFEPEPRQPAHLIPTVSSKSPEELAMSTAHRLVDIAPRILTMSQSPEDWSVFLDRLLEALRKGPDPMGYQPL